MNPYYDDGQVTIYHTDLRDLSARDLGRRAIGVEISERYCELEARRLAQGVLEVVA
jgi:hypothetical protein